LDNVAIYIIFIFIIIFIIIIIWALGQCVEYRAVSLNMFIGMFVILAADQAFNTKGKRTGSIG